MTVDPEEHVRSLAEASLAKNDPVGWFDQLYVAATSGEAVVPWDRGTAHPLLAEWAEDEQLQGAGRSAVIVGCGFGFDAELIARCGFATVAFDISHSAVDAARARHPGSAVEYAAADLLSLPSDWLRAYDLVIEIMTVQALPRGLRAEATSGVTSLVAPGGTLLVIAAALDESGDGENGPPWPLTRPELDAFAQGGLDAVLVEEIRDPPGTHRWRARFERPADLG